MKSNPASDHVYINDGFKCSSISISTNLTETINGNENAGYQGSSEFILTKDGKKAIAPIRKADCFKDWLEERSRRMFNRKTLHKRLPILDWLPKYSSQDAVGDLVAGITVGLTVIPQALAYAGIAGLPAAYGLYASFLGCFVYVFLGSCKDVPIGPSAIIALLTYQTTQGSWQKAVLLTFLSGIIELLMGVFGLGFLIDFVSGPVSSGFTSAVALIILTSQVKDILGIHAKGTGFIQIWSAIFENISETRFTDTILGVTCIVVLLMLRILTFYKIGPSDPSKRTKVQNIVNKTLWVIGTSRNAILVIFCGAMGYILHTVQDGTPFKVIGYIPSGLPEFKMPAFSLNANQTASNQDESFFEVVRSLGSGLIVIPLISLLETISICKAFGNGKPVDATQELIAIGVSNIVNSFVQAFPSTGALSRGAVNNASGVRTPWSNVYSGTLVIIALIFLTPYFHYIPRATLAAIIISAVIFMVEVRVIKPMWRAKKTDLVPGLGTFVACLILPLEIGIMFGIGLNIIFILYHAARPKITVETLTTDSGIEYLIITPDRCLVFPSVDYVRNLVIKHSKRQNIPVVIDASHIYGADFTAAQAMESLLRDFAGREQLILFFNLKPSVCTTFETLSLEDLVVYYREEQLDELLEQHKLERKKTMSV